MDKLQPSDNKNAWLLTLAAIVIILAGLKTAAPIVAQFLMALFIAVITTPAISWMEKRKIPRALAITLMLIAILLLVYFVVYLIGDSIESFRENKQLYATKFQAQLSSLQNWLISSGLPAQNFDIAALPKKLDFMALISRAVGGLTVIFGDFFMIFLAVAFILGEAASFSDKFARAFSNSHAKIVHVNRALEKIRHYLKIKTATSALTGMLIYLSLLIIGVDYAFLWGVLAFFLNFIPTIGSIIAAVPALLLALVQLGPIAMLWTVISFFVVNNLVGNFLEPKFMGKLLGLSTFIVFLSLIFWGWIFGPVGMFLSVPLTMSIKIALETKEDTRWLAILLGPEGEPATKISDN